MPRIRTIKPEIHDDEEVGELSDSAFRLFIGCITQADDAGRLKGDPRLIGAKVWAYHPKPVSEVDELLSELAKADLIHRYEVDDKPFICLPGWANHQRVDNAGKSRIPEPDKGSRKVSPRTAANDGDPPLDQGRDQGEDQGSGSERAREEIPDHLHPIIQTLDAVAFSRNLSLKVGAAVKACTDYADRDLQFEVDKFRRYYTEGTGENRRMRDVAGYWRNWLDSSPSAANARGKSSKPADNQMADLERLEAEKQRLLAEEGAAA